MKILQSFLKFMRYFLNSSEREIRKLMPLVEAVNELEERFQQLSDSELADMTNVFRRRLIEGETTEDILAETFAVVREAAQRTIGQRHFDVQLIGGIVLHQGNIAEMKTGEGKTLAATLPVYLNALVPQEAWIELAERHYGEDVSRWNFVELEGIPVGYGVHVVTVNEYLASRDADWMGQIYRFLGLKVGLLVSGMQSTEKQKSYKSDVIYGTNNEFGFDYLRDNLLIDCSHRVQRQYYYAIVDEVDSILIDEARTPLIISGEGETADKLYQQFSRLALRLKNGVDYTVDEKARNVTITEVGIARVEKQLGLENLYDPSNTKLLHYLYQALKAHNLFRRDKDYIVKNGQVVIVDEFTGRLMEGRRYSDGLHQSLEAKEGVQVVRESRTVATVTLQNYFRMYQKLAGMTGTAETEAREFKEIYKLGVVAIPTNRELIRLDAPDVIFRSKKEKYNAVIEEIEACNQKGQPVLVGTITIDDSEFLADLLKKRSIRCNVLNAKQHAQEAEIVAQAGRLNQVTIATNMAGRGTDIVLGGNPEFLALQEVNPDDNSEMFERVFNKYQEECQLERQQVVAAGGLYIMGTERHESRRIDNQLRGRSGRQGDPGVTRFFLSLEDDLLRLFGSDRISGIMDRLGMEDNVPIENRMVSNALESAQSRVEQRNFEIRKHLLKYDEVMNLQREFIYEQRNFIMSNQDLSEVVDNMIEDVVENLVERTVSFEVNPDSRDFDSLLGFVGPAFDLELNPEELRKFNFDNLCELLADQLKAKVRQRREAIGSVMMDYERFIILQNLDQSWQEHLSAVSSLEEGIGLRSVGQKDPLTEFKIEAARMFEEMIFGIKERTLSYIIKVRIRTSEQPPEIKNKAEDYSTNKGSDGSVSRGFKKSAAAKKQPKIGPNDPCPCESGKKYKKCCGKIV